MQYQEDNYIENLMLKKQKSYLKSHSEYILKHVKLKKKEKEKRKNRKIECVTFVKR